MANRKRPKGIMVRLTEKEYADLREAVEREGTNAAEELRRYALRYIRRVLGAREEK